MRMDSVIDVQAPAGSQPGTPDRVEEAASILSAMSNTVRLGVLCRLTEQEWSVNELAKDL